MANTRRAPVGEDEGGVDDGLVVQAQGHQVVVQRMADQDGGLLPLAPGLQHQPLHGLARLGPRDRRLLRAHSAPSGHACGLARGGLVADVQERERALTRRPKRI